MNFYFNGKIVLSSKIKISISTNNNNNDDDDVHDDYDKDTAYNDANDQRADFPVVFS